jgi:hypothetical protein
MNIHNFSDSDINDIIKSYISGESELSISMRYSVSRRVIRKRLIDNNIAIRNGSDAMYVRMGKTTFEERCQLSKKAQEARRGQKETDDILIKRAKSRLVIGGGELQIIEWIKNRGQNPTSQFPLWKYNIDIAIHPVAVELMVGPHKPTTMPKLIERSEYIRNHGWCLLYVWVTKNHFLSEACADQIISVFNQVCSNPSMTGQEWMIRGDGQSVPVRSK